MRVHAYKKPFSSEGNHHAYLRYQIIFLCLPVDLTWFFFLMVKLKLLDCMGAILLELRFQSEFLKFHLPSFKKSKFQNWTW